MPDQTITMEASTKSPLELAVNDYADKCPKGWVSFRVIKAHVLAYLKAKEDKPEALNTGESAAIGYFMRRTRGFTCRRSRNGLEFQKETTQ